MALGNFGLALAAFARTHNVKWSLLAALAVGAAHSTNAWAIAISSFSPANGTVGTSLTINGSGFSTNKPSDIVMLSGVNASVTSATTTKLVVAVPSGSSTGKIQVTVGGATATSATVFTVKPTLSSFAPLSGRIGDTIILSGQGFSPVASQDVVTFHGVAATVISATPTQLTVKVPSTATNGTIKVAVGSFSSTSSSSFTVLLSVTGVSPLAESVGAGVTISGRGFSAIPDDNVVAFNGVQTVYIYEATSTSLVVGVPDGATSGPVTVTLNGDTATSPLPFTVLPGITAVAWNQGSESEQDGPYNYLGGPIGGAVTIVGTGFSANAEDNTVRFNGIASPVIDATETQLRVTIPAGAVTGPVTVSIGANTSLPYTRFLVLGYLSRLGDLLTETSTIPGSPVGFVFDAQAGDDLSLGIPALDQSGIPDPSAWITTYGPSLSSEFGRLTAWGWSFAGPAWMLLQESSDCMASCTMHLAGERPYFHGLGSGIALPGKYTILLNQSGDLTALQSASAMLTDTVKRQVLVSQLPQTINLARPGSAAEVWFDLTSDQNAQLRWSNVSTIGGEPLHLVVFSPNGEVYMDSPIPVAAGGNVNIPAPSIAGRYTAVFQTLRGVANDFQVSLASQSLAVTINSVTPTISQVGKPYVVHVSVSSDNGLTPTGSVIVSDIQNGYSCTIVLPQTSCAITPSVTWIADLYAQYSGDANFGTAISGQFPHSVVTYSSIPRIVTVLPEPSQQGSNALVIFSLPAEPQQFGPSGIVTVSDGLSSCAVEVGVGTTGGSNCFMPTPHAGVVSYVAKYSGDVLYATTESAPVSHAVSSAGGTNALPSGTTVCGYDTAGVYPAQSGFVPSDQLSGLIPSAGIASSIAGLHPLTIGTEAPNAGDVLHGNVADVSGVFDGPSNTGVTVNGIVGYTANGSFLVPNVPLDPGSNVLHIVATTLPGQSVSADVSVVSEASDALSIATTKSTNFAGSPIEFVYKLMSLPVGTTIAHVSLFFDTDIAYDQEGPDALVNAPTQHSYTSPGFHTAKLVVTDSNGLGHHANRTVLVQDHVEHRSMLCDVFGYLRTTLAAGDASGASLAYQPDVRDHYYDLFGSLGTNMSLISGRLGSVANGTFAEDYADLTLVRDNQDQSRHGYPMRITRGSDGVWRISEM